MEKPHSPTHCPDCKATDVGCMGHQGHGVYRCNQCGYQTNGTYMDITHEKRASERKGTVAHYRLAYDALRFALSGGTHTGKR